MKKSSILKCFLVVGTIFVVSTCVHWGKNSPHPIGKESPKNTEKETEKGFIKSPQSIKSTKSFKRKFPIETIMNNKYNVKRRLTIELLQERLQKYVHSVVRIRIIDSLGRSRYASAVVITSKKIPNTNQFYYKALTTSVILRGTKARDIKAPSAERAQDYIDTLKLQAYQTEINNGMPVLRGPFKFKVLVREEDGVNLSLISFVSPLFSRPARIYTNIKQGQPVYAIGYPTVDKYPCITEGRYEGKDYIRFSTKFKDTFGTSTSFYKGMNGGAIFTSEGCVAGVISGNNWRNGHTISTSLKNIQDVLKKQRKTYFLKNN